MAMFKTEIVIDEEKVLSEGAYDLQEIYDALDATFEKFNLPRIMAEDNTRIYRNGNDENDFANMWVINLELKNHEWFRANVAKWLWYLNENPDNPDELVIEDLGYYILRPMFEQLLNTTN